MGAKGIKYFKRGPKDEIQVGFFNHEVVLSILDNHPEGLPLPKIASKARLHYNTVRHLIFQLQEMNRVTTEKRKVKKKGVLTHYIKTPWRLD